MGTRAAFWIGDPRALDAREWIGCKAWDGYPGNPDLEAILGAATDVEFRDAVKALAASAKDFARPERGWPYPWSDDVFLTDFTYAFFGGGVQVSLFHYGFVAASTATTDGFEWPDRDDPSLVGVPAGKNYDPSQPDSILFISFGGTS